MVVVVRLISNNSLKQLFYFVKGKMVGRFRPGSEPGTAKKRERFFASWRRVPQSGTQEKAAAAPTQNDGRLLFRRSEKPAPLKPKGAAPTAKTLTDINARLKKSQPLRMTTRVLPSAGDC
jgi:hypothetical protein